MAQRVVRALVRLAVTSSNAGIGQLAANPHIAARVAMGFKFAH